MLSRNTASGGLWFVVIMIMTLIGGILVVWIVGYESTWRLMHVSFGPHSNCKEDFWLSVVRPTCQTGAMVHCRGLLDPVFHLSRWIQLSWVQPLIVTIPWVPVALSFNANGYRRWHIYTRCYSSSCDSRVFLLCLCSLYCPGPFSPLFLSTKPILLHQVWRFYCSFESKEVICAIWRVSSVRPRGFVWPVSKIYYAARPSKISRRWRICRFAVVFLWCFHLLL